MHQLIPFLTTAASQQPPSPTGVIPEGVDPLVWPYWVAIGGLSSAVVALFGYIQKIQNDNRADVKANSTRIAGEFAVKDGAILDIATKITEAVAQFVAAIDKLSGLIAGLITEVRTDSEKLQSRLERVEDKLEGREPRNRSN